MEEDLGAGHGGEAVEFGVAAIAADDEGAGMAVDFKERELVAAAAVVLLVATGHVDFGVFVFDGAVGGDDVGEVEVLVGSAADGTCDDPDVMALGSAAGFVEGCLDEGGIELGDVGKEVAGEVGLREENDAGAGLGGLVNEAQGFGEVLFEGAGPVHLGAGDLEGGGGHGL